MGANLEGDEREAQCWLEPRRPPQLFTARAGGSPPKPGHICPCLARERLLLLWSRTAPPSAAAALTIQRWGQLCDKGGACALLRWVIMLRACFTEMQGLSDNAHACSCCRGSWGAERRGQELEMTLQLGEPVVNNELLIPRNTHPTGSPVPPLAREGKQGGWGWVRGPLGVEAAGEYHTLMVKVIINIYC